MVDSIGSLIDINMAVELLIGNAVLTLSLYLIGSMRIKDEVVTCYGNIGNILLKNHNGDSDSSSKNVGRALSKELNYINCLKWKESCTKKIDPFITLGLSGIIVYTIYLISNSLENAYIFEQVSVFIGIALIAEKIMLARWIGFGTIEHYLTMGKVMME